MTTDKEIRARLAQQGYSEEDIQFAVENSRKGICALKDGWCLVHDKADTMDHHFEAHPGAYND